MRFRQCGKFCEFYRAIEEMMAPIAFHFLHEPGTLHMRSKPVGNATMSGAFHDEDHLSAELDAKALEERAQGGDPCAIIYTAHLNGRCPGELSGVSETEADTYCRMDYARPATDEEILQWFAQGCEDEPPIDEAAERQAIIDTLDTMLRK